MSIETNSQTTGRRSDDDFGTPPQSRVEQVLMNEQIKPQSRIERLLLEGGGGGGGTTDYNQLNHKPSINGVVLVGSKTLKELGIEWLWRGTRAQYEAAKATIPPKTFVDITDEPDMDTIPTQGSLNPVTSNGLYTELSKLKVINENPENHNGIYRGKDLTNIYTIEQIYERVHNGTFEDLYLGDYFTVHLTTDLMTRFTGSAFVAGTTYYEMDSGTDVTQRTWTVTQDETPQEGKVYATKEVIEEDVDYMIAGFDLYYNTGKDSSTTIINHHVIIIPKHLYETGAAYHYDGLARTGYAGSDMHNIVLPCYAESTRAALNNHVLQHTSKLNGTVDASVPSMCGSGIYGATVASVFATVYAQLMTEQQCFGASILSSSWRDIGLDYNKFPVFNYVNPIELDGNTRGSIMLRTFAFVNDNLDYFAIISGYGQVTATPVKPTNKGGVRPFYLFG